MTERVVILDSLVSYFGRHDSHTLLECLGAVGVGLLARHAGLAEAIDLVVVGCSRSSRSDQRENGLAQSTATLLGLPAVPGIDVKAFCASGNLAVITAGRAIAEGRAQVALVFGGEHLLGSQSSGPLHPESLVGPVAEILTPPILYGLAARRYQHEHGVPAAALAQVTVVNRAHASTNPHARFQTPADLAQVLESKMIAPPLTLLQCSASSDGSGTALLVSERFALEHGLDLSRSVVLAGTGWASAGDPDRSRLTSFSEDTRAAEQAYREANVFPADVGVAEVHDAFTISQLLHLEDIGLAERGRAWRDTLEGSPGLVVNPSGGLLGRGHPLGATGLAQVHGVREYLAGSDTSVGVVQESGGIQNFGQMLSSCMVLVAPDRH
jgi:acetyl-CoA acetyltransferase